MRTSTIGLLAAILFVPASSFAQGSFSIGPRLTFVSGSDELREGSERFTGGFIRMGGGKLAIEMAMDYRSEEIGDLNEKVKSYPIPGIASLLSGPGAPGAVRAGWRWLVHAAGHPVLCPDR